MLFYVFIPSSICGERYKMDPTVDQLNYYYKFYNYIMKYNNILTFYNFKL